jgi:23S rRNA pseudouridine1911/1915/1917 synthase
MQQRLVASEADDGKRIDKFVAEHIPDFSRTFLSRLIGDGRVTVNGTVALRPRQIIHSGDQVEIDFPPPTPTNLEGEERPLEILYEDESLAVIVKPAGLTVHPGAGCKSGTLANALVFHFSRLSQKDAQRPGIVHRLDRDTSGLLVIAKSERSHHKIARQFQQRTVEKRYLALVFGRGLQSHGQIDAPIGRHPTHRTRMAVVRAGRPALTQYDLIEEFHDFTFLKIGLKTGRTHQIRVHFAHLSHPVVGDQVYGRGRLQGVHSRGLQEHLEKLNRLFLHATYLRFSHPATGEELQFNSPLPEELASILDLVRNEDRVVR